VRKEEFLVLPTHGEMPVYACLWLFESGLNLKPRALGIPGSGAVEAAVWLHGPEVADGGSPCFAAT